MPWRSLALICAALSVDCGACARLATTCTVDDDCAADLRCSVGDCVERFALAGEGEGDVAEGEGEGEGEVAAGEGEGEGAGGEGEGEGEGEGSEGEGEGEGEVATGEGEGEGGLGDACAADDVAASLATVVHGGHCYALLDVPGGERWPLAARTCASRGGHLAVPSTPTEDLAVRALVDGAGSVDAWLGVVDWRAEFALECVTGEGPLASPVFGEALDGVDEDCFALRDFGAGAPGVQWRDAHCVDDVALPLCELPLESAVDGFCGDSLVQPALGESCDDDGGACAGCGAAVDVGFAWSWSPSQGELLLGFAGPATFFEAEFFCEALAISLVSADDVAEAAQRGVVARRLGGDAWIGYDDVVNEANADALAFRRVDASGAIIGGSGGFHNFAGGAPSAGPSDDCVVVGAVDDAWRAVDCATPRPFICAVRAP